MWDNPRLLNAAAGFLVGLTVLAGALVAAHWLLRSSLFPVRSIELRTPLKNAARAGIEDVLARQPRSNFFAADLGELRRALEQQPWVRRASVRRAWPDRLEVSIEEHIAFARWGADVLVNTHGERFAGTAVAGLPLFVGPAGTEGEMTRRYRRYRPLLEPLGSPIERLVLSERYAWQLRLASGLQITLGRDADLAEQRLQRFVGAYAAALDGRPAGGEFVDLRYPNGFALRSAREKAG